MEDATPSFPSPHLEEAFSLINLKCFCGRDNHISPGAFSQPLSLILGIIVILSGSLTTLNSKALATVREKILCKKDVKWCRWDRGLLPKGLAKFLKLTGDVILRTQNATSAWLHQTFHSTLPLACLFLCSFNHDGENVSPHLYDDSWLNISFSLSQWNKMRPPQSGWSPHPAFSSSWDTRKIRVSGHTHKMPIKGLTNPRPGRRSYWEDNPEWKLGTLCINIYFMYIIYLYMYIYHSQINKIPLQTWFLKSTRPRWAL